MAKGTGPLRTKPWPFTPSSLSEILDRNTLAVIEAGCCERLKRALTILDYDPDTGGFTHRIESISPFQRYERFCLLLRDERYVQGGDRACADWDIEQARVSLDEFRRTGDPFRNFRCHMRLHDMTYVIRIKGRPVALLFSGQYRPPGCVAQIQERVEQLGTADYPPISAEVTQRDQLKKLATDLHPLPEDARARLEAEAMHIQDLAEATFWSRFFPSSRHCSQQRTSRTRRQK